MERQLTMASVPIVRYYDHLRFVYEVESRVRELRSESEGEGSGEQRKQDAAGDAGRDKTESGANPGTRERAAHAEDRRAARGAGKQQ